MKNLATVIIGVSMFACAHGEKSGDNSSYSKKEDSFELKPVDKGPSYSLSGTLSTVPDESSADLAYVAPGGKYIGVYEETQLRSPQRGVIATLKIYDISENILLFDKSVVHYSKDDDLDFTSASDKAKNDLETLADKRIKELGLLRLASNPRFAEKNVELIKKYDDYYSSEGSSRHDSIFWNDGTYEFTIGNPKAPIVGTTEICKNTNNPDYQITINGKTISDDGRHPSSTTCPSTRASSNLQYSWTIAVYS